jgi:hypothetical protein
MAIPEHGLLSLGRWQQGQFIVLSVVFTLHTPATTVVFGSYLSSLYSLLKLYRRCGLACAYDWRGVVGAKKKTCVGLLIIPSSLGYILSKLLDVHCASRFGTDL